MPLPRLQITAEEQMRRASIKAEARSMSFRADREQQEQQQQEQQQVDPAAAQLRELPPPVDLVPATYDEALPHKVSGF